MSDAGKAEKPKKDAGKRREVLSGAGTLAKGAEARHEGVPPCVVEAKGDEDVAAAGLLTAAVEHLNDVDAVAGLDGGADIPNGKGACCILVLLHELPRTNIPNIPPVARRTWVC